MAQRMGGNAILRAADIASGTDPAPGWDHGLFVPRQAMVLGKPVGGLRSG